MCGQTLKYNTYSSFHRKATPNDTYPSSPHINIYPHNNVPMLHPIITTYHDVPSCGQIAFSHNTATGNISVDFERFDAADGVVLPQYHLDLTTEHAAAWAGSVLLERCGRRSKVITGRHDGRRFSTAVRLTAADSNLVYYTHSAEGVVVLRGGRARVFWAARSSRSPCTVSGKSGCA